MWRTSRSGSLVLDPLSSMLVAAMRVWQDGRRNWHVVRREFSDEMGEAVGDWALGHLEDVLSTINNHARRSLVFAKPGDVRPTADELFLVRAFAAIQRDEFDLLATVLESMFPPFHRAEPAVDMMAFARLLSRNGLMIGHEEHAAPLPNYEFLPVAAE